MFIKDFTSKFLWIDIKKRSSLSHLKDSGDILWKKPLFNYEMKNKTQDIPVKTNVQRKKDIKNYKLQQRPKTSLIKKRRSSCASLVSEDNNFIIKENLNGRTLILKNARIGTTPIEEPLRSHINPHKRSIVIINGKGITKLPLKSPKKPSFKSKINFRRLSIKRKSLLNLSTNYKNQNVYPVLLISKLSLTNKRTNNCNKLEEKKELVNK